MSDRPQREAPAPLGELLASLAVTAKEHSVPEGEWEAAKRRERLAELRDDLEATIPRRYAWARFTKTDELSQNPEGELVAPEWWQRSLDAVGFKHVVWQGPSAAGKSSLAAAALRRWVTRSHKTAMWCNAHQLVLARTQHPMGRDEPPLVRRAIGASLCLLDDLGAGNVNASDACADVIRERINFDRGLWITTGLTLEELKVRYDGGAIRRILEHAIILNMFPPEGS